MKNDKPWRIPNQTPSMNSREASRAVGLLNAAGGYHVANCGGVLSDEKFKKKAVV